MVGGAELRGMGGRVYSGVREGKYSVDEGTVYLRTLRETEWGSLILSTVEPPLWCDISAVLSRHISASKYGESNLRILQYSFQFGLAELENQ